MRTKNGVSVNKNMPDQYASHTPIYTMDVYASVASSEWAPYQTSSWSFFRKESPVNGTETLTSTSIPVVSFTELLFPSTTLLCRLVLPRCAYVVMTSNTVCLETSKSWDVSITPSPARRAPTV
ncbi:hypothetical protein TNCV_2929501 [Trichonephila clavipes]|nr:hypothetical protein TNCV_2929501 [Trichonephila clavipes]